MDISRNLQNLFSLEDKVILFTGAAGGIGAAVCKGLAAVGGKVALCDINMEQLQVLEAEIAAEGGTAKSFSLELPNADSMQSCVDSVISEFGQIDVLVNCAGINIRQGCLDVKQETFDKIVDINLKGTFFMSQLVGQHMVSRKKGSIINFASTNGGGNILGGCGVYGATKNGLVSLTRSQAIELAKHNIRSNAVAPGAIMTPLSVGYWEDAEKSQFLLDRIAMNRPGVPEELLGLIVLLSSDASSYMTGGMYIVDGGYLAGGQTWQYDTAY